jgi:hypothetical protein
MQTSVKAEFQSGAAASPLRISSFCLLLLLPTLLLAQDDSGGADNTIHAITTLHEDGTKTVTITDPEKRTSEAATYDGRDRLLEKIVYALDDQNQVTSGVVYTAANKPVFKTSYKRDDANRISEEDDYTMDDQLIRRFVYEFGANGKVSRIRAYDSQGNEMQQSDARKDQRQSLPRVH